MTEFRRALGLMSGTSMDGVDVALLETDGETVGSFGPTRTFPYSETDQALLRQALQEAASLADRTARPGALAEAENLVTARHAEAVETFLAEAGNGAGPVEVVGFHGQTVLHDPARRLTVQIGDGRALAERLGLPVVWDFRADDVAAGGQGAPLVPIFHQALADRAGVSRPVAFLNVGGVANVTYTGTNGALIAFDTGPGNALLDDWVRTNTGLAFDADGKLAAEGRPAADIVRGLLRHPYFSAAPPKSLDRYSFLAPDLSDLSPPDGAATLLLFTARAAAAALPHLPQKPQAWHVCGGGRRNGELLRLLREQLDGAPVEPVEALGFDGDAIEAQAFAFLAVRTIRGLPLTFPATTGVPTAMQGGRMSRPETTG